MPEWRRIENCSQKWKSSSLVSLFFWRINCLLKVWVRSGPDIQLLIWYPWVAMVNVWTVRCNCHRPLCIAECFLYPAVGIESGIHTWPGFATEFYSFVNPAFWTDINADPGVFYCACISDLQLTGNIPRTKHGSGESCIVKTDSFPWFQCRIHVRNITGVYSICQIIIIGKILDT